MDMNPCTLIMNPCIKPMNLGTMTMNPCTMAMQTVAKTIKYRAYQFCYSFLFSIILY
jgi:hypothetical protein